MAKSIKILTTGQQLVDKHMRGMPHGTRMAMAHDIDATIAQAEARGLERNQADMLYWESQYRRTFDREVEWRLQAQWLAQAIERSLPTIEGWADSDLVEAADALRSALDRYRAAQPGAGE